MPTQTQTKTTTAPKPVYRKLTAKQFARLSPATQRVKIAEDALFQLYMPKSKRYVVERGSYCEIQSAKLPDNSAEQFQAVLPNIQKDCVVCAMGVLFLSHVRINNAITLAEAAGGSYHADSEMPEDNTMDVGSDYIQHTMKDYFTPKQLGLVECAFEGSFVSGWGTSQESDAGYRWVQKFPDDTKRLRAICRNIIRNKGDFNIMQVTPPGRKK